MTRAVEGVRGSPCSSSMNKALVTSRPVAFPGPGEHRLSGFLELPDGAVRATAVFAHCFTCGSRSPAALRISRGLARQGIAVLRFDFTGLGKSDGDFADTGFGSNVDDLVAAANWLGDEVGPVTLLVGHSLGGAAVIAAAGRLPKVQAVAVVGAPAAPEHVAHLVSDLEAVAATEGDPAVAIHIGGRPFQLRRSFLDEIRGVDQDSRIAALGRALLVLHSPVDEIVGVDNARRIFETARHPKSFVALDGADHLLTDAADSAWAAELIATWAARYVPDLRAAMGRDEKVNEEPAAGDDDASSTVTDGTVLVQELDGEDGFTHRAITAAHSWLLDEPASVGGADLGPSPYDELLAGLGACTSMTMRMYARRKGWDVAPAQVRLSHERIHAADCEDCETSTGMLDRITRVITLDPALPPEQRTALLRIADKCPVHRTLTNEVEISTTVV